MASNIDVGLGLGLQAQLQAPAQVFARQQQQKIASQQLALKRAAEDDDVYARLQKDVSVNSKDLHRLVKKSVADISANAINELLKAKNSGDLNWRNKAVEITNGFKNELAHLSGLSEQYKNYEKNYEMLGNYKTREQQSLRELMNGSQTYTEMLEKAKTKGVGGVDVESGLLTSNQFMPRVDLNRTLDNTFSKVSPINVDIKMIKEGGKDIEQVTTRVPLMEDEASVIAQQRGLTFVPSIQSTAREIVADPVLRSQYADTYNINPQDEAALMTSIMNEGRKFVEEGVKRKYLSNPNIKVYVNTGAEQDVLGFNKSVQDLDTGGFKTASAAVLGVNAPGYSTVSSKNLVDQTGKPVVGGTLSDMEVNEVRVLPYVTDSKTKVLRPAIKGEKNSVLGYKPFVMFGKTGSKFFLPAGEFTYTGLMKGGKDISMTIQNSVTEMNAYADQLNSLYIAERKKEGPIKNAFASGDVYTLTNELKNKIK
jgi:hypothetical protein